jgi:hypothetical protein
MSSISSGSPGFVYIATSSTLSAAGLLKIGATTHDPDLRMKQLSASTSSPTPFFVAYSRRVPDVNLAERELHEFFEDRRVNEGREFFQVTLYEAAITLDRLVGGMPELVDQPETPFSELFASFPDDGTGRELTEFEAAQCRELAAKTR